MRIQNSNTFSAFQVNHKPRNTQISSVVHDLNAKAAQKNSSFDIAEISLRAKQLKQTETDEKLLKQKDSPYNGCLTQVEWAKESLTTQRIGVNAVKNALLFAKDQLEHKMGELSEFEGGDGQVSDSAITGAAASGITGEHKVSVTMNFAELVKSTVDFYNWQVEATDKASNGLASKVMENQLGKISAQSLGLADLSKDPDEIMKALDGAIEKLKNLSDTIADRFHQTSGEHMKSEPHKVDWVGMLEMEIQISEAQTNSNQSVRKLKMTEDIEIQDLGSEIDFSLSGETLKMDADFLEKWNMASDQS